MKANIHLRLIAPWLGLLFLTLALAGCNYPSQATPTESGMNATQAFETVQARLTEAVALTPTNTPEPTATTQPTATLTPQPETSLTPSPSPTSGPTATLRAGCDQASPGNPIDVTIPDDTQLRPGEAFVKTWRLRNTGTCTWNTTYDVVWFSGERLGAPSDLPLNNTVAPNETVDVTVEMVAPLTPGTYQSNWKMRNASGVLFGLGSGDGLPFYVRIIVVDAPTLTPTGQPSATVTPTPGPVAFGPATMLPGDRIDLDTNLVNGGAASDLLYAENTADTKHYLTPENNAAIAVYGGFKPDLGDCLAASLGFGGIPVEDLAIGTYLCYNTSQDLTGYARITGFDAATARLNLDIYTWESP